MDQPVRIEFFDDEVDSMGTFDPSTQRRVKNVHEARLLPAAEVLPGAAEGGLTGLAARLKELAEKLEKKHKAETLVQTLRQDAERLENGAALGGADRYLAAVYSQTTTALDYLPPDTLVVLCESGRVEDRVKSTLTQLRQDTELLMEQGLLAGEYAALTLKIGRAHV